jgi:hypothetical protein
MTWSMLANSSRSSGSLNRQADRLVPWEKTTVVLVWGPRYGRPALVCSQSYWRRRRQCCGDQLHDHLRQPAIFGQSAEQALVDLQRLASSVDSLLLGSVIDVQICAFRVDR